MSLDVKSLEKQDLEIQDQDFYAFDLNGYLVVEDAVDPDLLAELNERADRLQEEVGVTPEGGKSQARVEPILTQHPEFLPLVMSPKVLARVVNFIQWPRLKSTWLDFKGKGGNIHFHSNHTPYEPVDAYHFTGGTIHCNLLTVCYALQDVPLDGAALEVIPGSHKSNFPLPEDEEFQKPLRRQLPLQAGSALMFSHDVNHGSYNHLDYVRRTVFTSFSTGMSAHTQGEDDMYDSFFEQSPEGSWQKYLLRRPKGNKDSYPQPEHSIVDEFLSER